MLPKPSNIPQENVSPSRFRDVCVVACLSLSTMHGRLLMWRWKIVQETLMPKLRFVRTTCVDTSFRQVPELGRLTPAEATKHADECAASLHRNEKCQIEAIFYPTAKQKERLCQVSVLENKRKEEQHPVICC